MQSSNCHYPYKMCTTHLVCWYLLPCAYDPFFRIHMDPFLCGSRAFLRDPLVITIQLSLCPLSQWAPCAGLGLKGTCVISALIGHSSILGQADCVWIAKMMMPGRPGARFSSTSLQHATFLTHGVFHWCLTCSQCTMQRLSSDVNTCGIFFWGHLTNIEGKHCWPGTRMAGFGTNCAMKISLIVFLLSFVGWRPFKITMCALNMKSGVWPFPTRCACEPLWICIRASCSIHLHSLSAEAHLFFPNVIPDVLFPDIPANFALAQKEQIGSWAS